MGYRLLYLLALLIFSLQCPGQGKLILYSDLEPDHSWISPALQWAEKQSPAASVALISTKGSPEFLFPTLDSLNLSYTNWSPQTAMPAEELLKHGIWFLDGEPNDSLFSPAWKQLIRRHYQSGGVLMAPIWIETQILTAYPDFLFSQSPGVHISEEILLSAMARNQQSGNYRGNGLSLDSETSLAINEFGQATVLGAGAVRFYFNDISSLGFPPSPTMVNDSIRLLQLVAGGRFHFRSWASEGFNGKIMPKWRGENGNHSLLISGSNALSENAEFLNALVQSYGKAEDPILLISGWTGSNLEVLKLLLTQRGAREVFHLHPDSAFQQDPILRNQIIQTDKRLFVGNDIQSLRSFLSGGHNGRLLSNQMHEAGAFNAFIGDDSRFAGASFFTASPSSMPEIVPGLGLLRTTAIWPFMDQEVASSSPAQLDLPLLMLKDSLCFGYQLYPETYVSYQVIDGTAYLSPHGKRAVKVFRHTGGSVSLPTLYSDERTAFAHMSLTLLHNSDYPIGTVQSSMLTHRGSREDWLTIYPNPFRDNLNIFFYGQQKGVYEFQLISPQGDLILSQRKTLSPSSRRIQIGVPQIPTGVYLLLVKDSEQKVVRQLPLIH